MGSKRLAAAMAARPGLNVVVIDPRRTATCDLADLDLAIAPGADAALFNALLAEVLRRGAEDPAFLTHDTGLEAAAGAALASDPALARIRQPILSPYSTSGL